MNAAEPLSSGAVTPPDGLQPPAAHQEPDQPGDLLNVVALEELCQV